MNTEDIDIGHSVAIVPLVPELAPFEVVKSVPPTPRPGRRYLPMYQLFVQRYLFRHISNNKLYTQVSTSKPDVDHDSHVSNA